MKRFPEIESVDGGAVKGHCDKKKFAGDDRLLRGEIRRFEIGV